MKCVEQDEEEAEGVLRSVKQRCYNMMEALIMQISWLLSMAAWYDTLMHGRRENACLPHATANQRLEHMPVPVRASKGRIVLGHAVAVVRMVEQKKLEASGISSRWIARVTAHVGHTCGLNPPTPLTIHVQDCRLQGWLSLASRPCRDQHFAAGRAFDRPRTPFQARLYRK